MDTRISHTIIVRNPSTARLNRRIFSMWRPPGNTFYMVVALLAFGCSNSYTVRPTPGNGIRSYEEFNEDIKDQDATIVFVNGHRTSAYNVEVKMDSLFWTDATTNVKGGAPRDTIFKVVVLNRLRGALDGMAVGTICALASTEAMIWAGHWSDVVLLPGVGMMAVSATIGAQKGHKIEYFFQISGINGIDPEQKNLAKPD